MTRVSDLILDSLQDSARDLTQGLRESARRAGWPAPAANSLTVQFDGAEFRVDASPAAEELEFGGVDATPRPGVRKWVNDAASSEAISSAVERRLRGES